MVRYHSDHLNTLTKVLTRAFWDDPVWRFFLPEEEVRQRVQPWMMRRMMLLTVPMGHAYVSTLDESCREACGGAFWVPPGCRVTEWALIKNGLLQLPFKLGTTKFSRVFRWLLRTDELQRVNMKNIKRHYYLQLIGIDPSYQGQGRGSRLMQPLTERADKERAFCYLETALEKDVFFYQRHGFHVLQNENAPGGGPPFWTMQRDPR